MDVHFIIYFSLLYLTFRKQTAPSRSYFDTAVSALFPVGHLLRFCVVCDAIVASFFFFNLYCFLYYHPVRSYDGCRIHSDSNRITHVKPVLSSSASHPDAADDKCSHTVTVTVTVF